KAEAGEVALRDVPALRAGTGEREADSVDDGALREMRRVLRDVGGLGRDRKAGDLVGDGMRFGLVCGVGCHEVSKKIQSPRTPRSPRTAGGASRGASRTACSSAPVVALPWPTMSNAVPWAGVVKTVSRPAVTVTPRLKPLSLVAIWPWS